MNKIGCLIAAVVDVAGGQLCLVARPRRPAGDEVEGALHEYRPRVSGRTHLPRHRHQHEGRPVEDRDRRRLPRRAHEGPDR